MKNLRAELEQRKKDSLYRRRLVIQSPQGAEVIIDGRRLLSFCSNDYLGLANHPDVRQAFIKGTEQYGVGSGAAHLVNGHSQAHHALEEELADFTGYPRALLFSTGYMANLGVAQSLCGRGDAVFEDRLNHASLLDAGQISGARLQRYPHLDLENLRQKLSARIGGEKLVLTDAVFSMDGDLAPIPQLAEVCRQQKAWLMVDDAHGLGVLGQQGRGSLEHYQCSRDQVPIYMGTLGKGLGTAGAFVAGSEDLIEFLIQKARTYIYTTAMPSAVAEATRASLKLVQTETWRREQLNRLIALWRSGAEQLGLQLMPSTTPIQPVLVGDAARAVKLSQKLRKQNILITAIRPPTVPEGTARLRITLSAAHSEAHIEQLLATFEKII